MHVMWHVWSEGVLVLIFSECTGLLFSYLRRGQRCRDRCSVSSFPIISPEKTRIHTGHVLSLLSCVLSCLSGWLAGWLAFFLRCPPTSGWGECK